MVDERLRIAFVCAADNLSGGNRVIAQYARQLAERGHSVTLVVPLPTKPSLRSRVRTALREGWRGNGAEQRISFFRDGPFQVRWLDHPEPIVKEDVPDADVVIATWWSTANWVWDLPASKGAKLHFMQDYEVWGAPNGDVSFVDRTCALPIPKIVIAGWVKDLLETRFGQTPLALIPNSVEADKFHAPPRGKQPIPTVGFTYSRLRSKGSDISLAAIELARKSIPELKVISFGGLWPPDDAANVDFHLQVPDEELRTLYAACDAWLFSTRIEAFGLPILEAMACRTPVIGTPAGAGRVLIGQGGGMLVPVDDPERMADCIVQIARMDEQTWRTMSDAAHRTATAYSWDEAADRFEAAVRTAALQRAEMRASA